MDAEKVTQVELGTEKPWLNDVAEVEQALRGARELEAWKGFGTIGFEAYCAWILQNSR